jgi:phenylpropionate dioxygenase-like ring-hydroxylating dioxygenase large terminal subunit
MTTAAENDVLTRVGPGTPMGEVMRQYWLPALKSEELKADGDPVRLRLLGENLVAFRDTQGRVGIMDHRCPHRCASLFFGRNEEGGIRCVYHGWKFDTDGNCLDMANVPPHQDFKHKVHAKAYKTAERNGVVWVYMGDQAQVPALPPIEANLLAEEEVNVWFVMRDCSYLQGLEGDMDTTHLGFLHYGKTKGSDYPADYSQRYTAADKTPEFFTKTTDWGFMYAAVRAAEEGQVNVRISQFVMPCWTFPPLNPLDHNFIARAWVPVDDTHHMFVLIARKDCDPIKRRLLDGRVAGSNEFDYALNTTDWLGRWRLKTSMADDFGIDRARQKNETFTGIVGVTQQDFAVVESMGGIVDRTLEHLAQSDAAVAQTRRVLLRAAEDVAKGKLPASAAEPEIVGKARGGSFFATRGALDGDGWIRLYEDRMGSAPFPGPAANAAE